MALDIVARLQSHLRAGTSPSAQQLVDLQDEIDRIPSDDHLATALKPCYHALFAPIRRLFPELLAEIFLWCLPSARFILPERNDAPLILGQVSYIWRSVALSTPRLWASCEVCLRDDPEGESHDSEERIVSLLSLWLARSGILPLSLSLRINCIHSPIVMDLINRYCYRWQHIAIEIASHFPPPLLLVKGEPLLQLESLELRQPLSFQFSAQDSPHLPAFAASAARLRRLVWDAEPFPPGIGWPNLVHLDIGSEISMKSCVLVVESCPVLADLICRNVREASYSTMCTPIKQTYLRTVTLSADVSFQPFFDCLTLPALTCLNLTTIGGEEEDTMWPTTSFQDFVSRSHCFVESFNAYFLRMNETTFLECARTLHHFLNELTLQRNGGLDCLFTDDVIDQLTYSEGIPCLLPRLEVLSLYSCIACAPGKLSGLVQSRLQDCAYPVDDPRYVAKLKIVEGFDTDADILALKNIVKQPDSGLTLRLYSRQTGVLLASLTSSSEVD